MVVLSQRVDTRRSKVVGTARAYHVPRLVQFWTLDTETPEVVAKTVGRRVDVGGPVRAEGSRDVLAEAPRAHLLM